MLEYTPHSPEQTLLHRVVREQLEPFLSRERARARPAPHFVEHELRAFLRCGILAHGFLRLRCDDCGHDRLVPFSCKRRGFCPSCGGRRMADTAAHLALRVLPAVPVRQWVLTLPYPIRYRCAYDAKLTSEVLRAFLRALFVELRRRVGGHWGVGRLQILGNARALECVPMTDAEHVAAFYRAFLGREPDDAGLAYHVDLIARSGGDLRPAIQSILTSAEYQARHTAPMPIAAARLLGRPLIIVDVGAQDVANEEHVYEPLLRAGVPCECIGFEPLAERRAARADRGGPPITLLPHFIGDGSKQSFYVNNEDNTSSLLPLNTAFNQAFSHLRELRTVRVEPVETSKLDDVLHHVARVDFLKLDIQGFELAALHGAIDLLARTNVVHCEVEFAPIYRDQPLFSEVERFLREHRFAFIDFVTTMRYRYAAVPDPSELQERLCWADAVFFRTLDGHALSDDALAQAVIASHVYEKNGLAKQILLDAGQVELLNRALSAR